MTDKKKIGIDLSSVETPTEYYARLRQEEQEELDKLLIEMHRDIGRELKKIYGNERYWEND